MSQLSDLLAEAFDYFQEHGFTDEVTVRDWVRRLEDAARASMAPQEELQAELRRRFTKLFEQTVAKIGRTPGVARFTVQNVHPALRAVLDRRILASAALIKLNRDEMIGATLRRFVGWVTSLPAEDQRKVDRAALREQLGKPLRSLPWAERRVMIDQGHKLVANVSATVAEGGGAIAARWVSHWRQENYDYREKHKERDGNVYVIRDSWAAKAGSVRRGDQPWSDEITQPAEEPFCRCNYTYLYHLRQLPEECLTAKGREKLAEARVAS